MSLEAITWAFRQEIPGTAKLVLLSLANRADDESGQCWPGLPRIAKDSSCSVRAAQIHIAALARNGFIEVRRMYATDGRQRSNHYWLLFDRAPAEWKSVANSSPSPNGEGEDFAPHTITTEAVENPVDITQNPDGKTHEDSPGRVKPDSPPIIEPSESEPSSLVLVARAPCGDTPASFDPKQRQAQIQKLQAAEEARRAQPVFVFEGTEAWKAWAATRPRGYPVTVRESDRRRGWWFPSLFPPHATGPPLEGLQASLDDLDRFGNEMTG
jgi:hypothetical protein